jgi:superoxide dismutase, Fe-Mn family
MSFELPPLPYAKNALAPHMSEQTLDFHYGKHHNGYVVKLNSLVPGTKYESMSLMDVIAASSKVAADKGIFNNSAQIWNHSFFWAGMSAGASKPSGRLAELINSSFGSMEDFKKKFLDVSANHFGSGYSWLTLDGGKLVLSSMGNAETPIASGGKPLLNCDVWEHAYYLDYQNLRPKFLETFFDTLVNWDAVATRLAAIEKDGSVEVY